MASNTSLVAGDRGEQTTSAESSPVVSVDSCDDSKQDDKSDSDVRRKTTPVIREPSQSSEKSTPVSPMDNAFFPGPEKWWYQKESEPKGGSKKGSFLDLEPDNWWGCRRHSEADIIGIPPPSPDRRHSFSPESSSSKATTTQDCKIKEKSDVKMDELKSNKTSGTNGCHKGDSTEVEDDDLFVTSDKERPKHLNPSKSDVIDLSDVDEEQEPVSDKDDTGVCLEHPSDGIYFRFDVPMDFEHTEFKDPDCEKMEEKVVILDKVDDEHKSVHDQSGVTDQTDCPHVELTDVNVDLSEDETKAYIDQEHHHDIICDKSDGKNGFDARLQFEQLQSEADSSELQSTPTLGHSTEIQNSETSEESNNNENIEKSFIETPDQIQRSDDEILIPDDNDIEISIPVDNNKQIVENDQNKTCEPSPDILDSTEDISLDQEDKLINENLSPRNDKSESVETETIIKSESCPKEFNTKEQSANDVCVSDVINDDGTFGDKSKELLSDKRSDQLECPQITFSSEHLPHPEDVNIHEIEKPSSSDKRSYQEQCPQITFSSEHLPHPEDENICETDEPSPCSSKIVTSPVVKESPIYVEETPVLLSHDQVKPTHHQTSGLSQRCRKGKLQEDEISPSKEPTCRIIDDAKWNSFQIFISVCVVLLLLGYLALSSLLSITISLFLEDPDDMSCPSKPSREVILSQHLKHLEEDFPSQDPVLWNVIENAVLNHAQDFSLTERPLTILLAGLTNANFTMSCLATKLGVMFDDIFQSSQHHIVENGNLYQDKSADYTKDKIDEMLKLRFQCGSKCAIIHNVDLLPPCTITLFLNYENVPFKVVSFVYTIQLQRNLEDLGEKYSREDCKRVVHDYLQSIWEKCSDMTQDNQNVLLSRIAGNVVVIKEESGDHLRKVCSQ